MTFESFQLTPCLNISRYYQTMLSIIERVFLFECQVGQSKSTGHSFPCQIYHWFPELKFRFSLLQLKFEALFQTCYSNSNLKR